MYTHDLLLIQDLAVIMLVAGLITVLCHRFKQPVVFGYIVAGMIIGPHTPPISFISDQLTIKTLGELGVIFLMFSLGLEFNLHKLSKIKFGVCFAALAEIVLMIWLGYEIGLLFNWSKIDALFLGCILSISSTTIIIKALDELGSKKARFAQLIFGILILEDIFAIVILALLSSIATSGTLELKDTALTVIKLLSFLVVSLLIGILCVPRLLNYIAKFNSNEMILISVLGICFGFCLLVVKLNYSIALGAFLIGAVMAESKQLPLIERLVEPLRDMFSAIFFVSVGLLIDFRALVHYFDIILIITAVVIVGKVLTSSLSLLITGYDGKTAMRVGMGLAQIGEFSFIIASLGVTLDVTSEFLYPIAVAVSALTTLTTPYLIKYSDTLTHYGAAILPKRMRHLFELYTSWIQNIQPTIQDAELAKKIKWSIVQVIANIFVVLGIFLSGAYLAKTDLGHSLTRITNIHIQKTVIWSIALICSLAFLIAIYRKIKALSMLLAEMSITENADSRLTINVRRIIAQMIPIFAITGIMLLVCVAIASILPPIEFLIIVFVIGAILIALLFPWFIKLHTKLHVDLIETLKKKE